MKIIALSILATTLSMPAFAATPISYSDLISVSLGDSSPDTAIDRLVTVLNAKNSDFGYFGRREDNTAFLCDSGDPALVKSKLKRATFRGTTVGAQGYEGLTIWKLKDCQQLSKGKK